MPVTTSMKFSHALAHQVGFVFGFPGMRLFHVISGKFPGTPSHLSFHFLESENFGAFANPNPCEVKVQSENQL